MSNAENHTLKVIFIDGDGQQCDLASLIPDNELSVLNFQPSSYAKNTEPGTAHYGTSWMSLVSGVDARLSNTEGGGTHTLDVEYQMRGPVEFDPETASEPWLNPPYIKLDLRSASSAKQILQSKGVFLHALRARHLETNDESVERGQTVEISTPFATGKVEIPDGQFSFKTAGGESMPTGLGWGSAIWEPWESSLRMRLRQKGLCAEDGQVQREAALPL